MTDQPDERALAAMNRKITETARVRGLSDQQLVDDIANALLNYEASPHG